MKYSIQWVSLCVFSALFLSAFAMADGGKVLVCQSPEAYWNGSLVVSFQLTNVSSDGACTGSFEMDSRTPGAIHPDQDSGSVSGKFSETNSGIDADLTFTPFRIPAHLVAHQSQAILTLGEEGNSNATELQCAIQ